MPRSSPSATRTTDILRFFAEHPDQSFTLTDLINALQLSRATCHALLQSLTEAGFLFRSTSKRYVMGPTLVHIGRVARDHFSPHEVARMEMRDLADAFNAVCCTLFQEGDEVVLKDRTGSAFHLGWLPPLSLRTKLEPPWGLVFVAWADPRRVNTWLQQARNEPGMTRAALTRGLERTRERGFSFGVRRKPIPNVHVWDLDEAVRVQHTDYVASDLDPDRDYMLAYVAAPVFNENGGVAFVLSLSGFPDSKRWHDIEAIGQRLTDTCRRVTEFMGGLPPAVQALPATKTPKAPQEPIRPKAAAKPATKQKAARR